RSSHSDQWELVKSRAESGLSNQSRRIRSGPLGLQFFEPLPHPLAQSAHGAFGATKRFADLLRRVALQAQLDDASLVTVQTAQQLLDRLGEDRSLVGSRLAPHGVAPLFEGIRSRRQGQFAGNVAGISTMVAHPVGAFAHRDAGEQSPHSAPSLGRKRPFAIADQEALVHRLNHVFNIDLVLKLLVEPGARQPDETSREALRAASGVVLPGFWEQVIACHAQLSGEPAGPGRKKMTNPGRCLLRPGCTYCTRFTQPGWEAIARRIVPCNPMGDVSM